MSNQATIDRRVSDVVATRVRRRTTDLPEVGDLVAMDRARLLSLWQDLFGVPAPKALSQSFLRRFLAFELQSRRYGGLSKPVQRAVTAGSAKASRTSSTRMRPGTRLLREWNGVTHVLDVTEEGFLWQGQTYRSLSAIARAITGAHWSGPRFFGLTGRAT